MSFIIKVHRRNQKLSMLDPPIFANIWQLWTQNPNKGTAERFNLILILFLSIQFFFEGFRAIDFFLLGRKKFIYSRNNNELSICHNKEKSTTY